MAREVITPDGRHISERYRMPNGEPLQVWPMLGRSDFESEDDHWDYMDEFTRFNNFLAPADHELLEKLATAHSVKPATMARILVARGVRAAFEDD